MAWGYRVYGGAAAGLGAVAVTAAGLLALGVGPLIGAPGTRALALLMPASAFALCLGMFLTTLALKSLDRALLLSAFRCLPAGLRAGLGALALAGAVLASPLFGDDENLHDPRARDGAYSAYRTTAGVRGTIEISRATYLELRRNDDREFLAGAGAMLAGAAFAALTLGELRRPAVRA
ncbi:hypothetical protein [Streptomyces sp. NPDC051921]|uniref:hypothetical protein n=1 Tax=Streptomyces sp. NPDC051921 TaxID=3155806 RepID=UPI0034419898